VTAASHGPGGKQETHEEKRTRQATAAAEAPVPEGFDTLYMFSGLTKGNTGEDLIATIIHCTNLGQTLATIEIQLFDVTATDLYTARVDVSSGRT
jgi:hypothetical protein